MKRFAHPVTIFADRVPRIGRVLPLLLMLAVIAACNRIDTTQSSPFFMRSTITPNPVVGREVIWHIEAGVDSSSSKGYSGVIRITLPPDVELVRGSPEWMGDIPLNATVSVDFPIRVRVAGTHRIDAVVGHDEGPSGGFSVSQALVITSSATSATVTDLLDLPLPTVQPHAFDQATSIP